MSRSFLQPQQRKGIVKGIILAGGSGTRLYPMTLVISKQLLPVYDKPMIYYPLTTLMLAGIREILIISTPLDLPFSKRLLGDGSHGAIAIICASSQSPKVSRRRSSSVRNSSTADRPPSFWATTSSSATAFRCFAEMHAPALGATVFAYQVADPERYGVVEFDEPEMRASIEEKPLRPKSNWAVTGLYFYDTEVVDIAANLKPSARGELEITDLNRVYLDRGQLAVERMGRGFTWLDTGTPDSLLDAGEFVATLERRQGVRIACPEEVAFGQGFIDRAQLERLGLALGKSDYARYVTSIALES